MGYKKMRGLTDIIVCPFKYSIKQVDAITSPLSFIYSQLKILQLGRLQKKSTNLDFWLNIRWVGVDRSLDAQPPQQVFTCLLIML